MVVWFDCRASEISDGVQSKIDQIGQLIADLVMWKDVAKSTLWFGFGSLCFLSSCFSKGLTFRSVCVCVSIIFLICDAINHLNPQFSFSAFSLQFHNYVFWYWARRSSRTHSVKGKILCSYITSLIYLCPCLTCVADEITGKIANWDAMLSWKKKTFYELLESYFQLWILDFRRQETFFQGNHLWLLKYFWSSIYLVLI